MADEARIQSYLQIRKGNLDYLSRPNSFVADVGTAFGPSPGAVTVTTGGTDVAFTGLTTPALCRLMNLDSTNFAEYGVWDGATFHPLGELLPGETYVLRLSRNLTTFRLRANTASCAVLVEAFEQ